MVDSCSSGRKAAETVIIAENHCFTIEQGGQNITVVPGSVFGPFLSILFTLFAFFSIYLPIYLLDTFSFTISLIILKFRNKGFEMQTHFKMYQILY